MPARIIRRSDDFVFVPNGKDRKQTATLLVGTADEFGIDQRNVRATPTGFLISPELAGILKKETRKKTSGNRAAKKNSKEES